VSGPSQPKVEDEQWDDERIKGFLSLKPLDGNHEDYHILIQSYQHMTPDFFKRLLAMFVSDGRNVNAKSLQNETILDRVSQHVCGKEYLNVLVAQGAKRTGEI
jgi:hypothetical protein